MTRRDLLGFGTALAMRASGAVPHPSTCRIVPAPRGAKSPEGFGEFGFVCDSHTRRVFTVGDTGPSVLLLHELNGLSPDCLTLAKDLAKAGAGFRVYVPLLFGKPNQSNAVSGTFESCWTTQFNCATPWQGSPIFTWLRGLIRHAIVLHNQGANMGVIGMCETGGFPIALLSESEVKIAVMSQPALPLTPWLQSSIAVGEADMARARDQRTDAALLGLRFECDTICTEERFKYLRGYFGTRFETFEVKCPPHAIFHSHATHAVLTGGHKEHPEAFDLVVRRLGENLA